jgi:3-hydroxyisobutyrate dehydrogenase-like beta-hydroxyacid dehydrogenase
MKRIAVVGVRLLGGAVAERLLGNGFEVTGYDVIPRSKVGSDGSLPSPPHRVLLD